MKHLLYIVIAICLLFALPEFIMAQMPGLPGPPDQAPIVGGIGLLVAGGAAYAVYKLRSNKK